MNVERNMMKFKKIRIKLDAETIWWPPQKPPIPKNLLTYTIKGENDITHKYKDRKKKNNN
jgi:hypothetical protein